MQGSTVKCSFCGEDIRIGTRRCPYCGSLLNQNLSHESEYVQPISQMISDNSISEDNLTVQVKQKDLENPEDGIAGNDINTGFEEPVSKVNFVLQEKSNQGNNVIAQEREKTYKALGNGAKVFLTALFSIIPGLGQIIGIITGIVFINSDSKDKNSFGSALLIASILIFIVNVVVFFLLAVALYGY